MANSIFLKRGGGIHITKKQITKFFSLNRIKFQPFCLIKNSKCIDKTV